MKHHHRLVLEPLESRTLLATCHVTRLGDFGAGADIGGGHWRGDLRFCITKANTEPGPDIIAFSVTGTINLTGPLPDIMSDIDVQGPGSAALTVRRNSGGDYRIFNIASGATVQISGLTVANGSAIWGGGIRNAGMATLRDIVVSQNEARGGSLNGGGGIRNEGTMLIESSVVSTNLATAIYADGGGVSNTGDLTIIDSTITQNAAVSNRDDNRSVYGGGIYNSGSLSIYSSTIAENTSGDSDDFGVGGGIAHVDGVASLLNTTVASNDGTFLSDGILAAALTIISHSTIAGNGSVGIQIGARGDVYADVYMRNTIVAGHSSYDVYGPIHSAGYNLIEDPTGGSGFAPTDILNVNPMLGPLADNGGPTQTMALLPGSAAIDAGENSDAPEWDQRGPGFPRIVNGRIDIGAYEVQATGVARPVIYLAVLSTADLDDEE
jgi:hypothetical protein